MHAGVSQINRAEEGGPVDPRRTMSSRAGQSIKVQYGNDTRLWLKAGRRYPTDGRLRQLYRYNVRTFGRWSASGDGYSHVYNSADLRAQCN